MKTFGEAAAGIFAAPTAVEDEILEKYGVRVIGRSDEITEHALAGAAVIDVRRVDEVAPGGEKPVENLPALAQPGSNPEFLAEGHGTQAQLRIH